MVVAITNQQQSLDEIKVRQGNEEISEKAKEESRQKRKNKSKKEIENMSKAPVMPIMQPGDPLSPY